MNWPDRSVSQTSGAPLDLVPGYLIDRAIHRGGQGVVYRAVQSSTGRTVAIKLMKEGPFAGPHETARFEREVQVLEQINHPNIAHIIDSGVVAGTSYFVMEFVDGVPLDVYVMRRAGQGAARWRGAAFTIPQALTLVARVCDAIHAAHLRGVIHRDLKPGNILIDAAGEPHIVDFGLAKVFALDHAAPSSATIITETGQFLGSLPWSSPEQATGSLADIDIRSDVYSLGVILFQVLTGDFPYHVGGSIRDVVDRILTADPVRPSTRARQIDGELETIVLKALSKERDRRYQSAGDLARDIRHYLAREPIDARRDSMMYVLRKQVQRYRLQVAAAAAIVVLLIASSIVAWVLYGRADRAAADAHAAELKAVSSLRDSLVAQARASRQTGRLGQRTNALDALTQAAAIRPSIELRHEAIAAMALVDFRPIGAPPIEAVMPCCDSALETCAFTEPDMSVTVQRLNGRSVLAVIPPPSAPVLDVLGSKLTGSHFIRLYDSASIPRRLEVWRVPEASLVLELTDIPTFGWFDISDDQSRLAVSGSDQAIHIYDLESAREIQRVPTPWDPCHLKFDHTGRYLARFHGRDEQAAIHDLHTGEVVDALVGAKTAWAVGWSSDGRVLAGAEGDRINLWDVTEQRSLGSLQGHKATVVGLRFDGDVLISGSWDGEGTMWEWRTGRPLLRVLGLCGLTPDGRALIWTPSGDPKRLHRLHQFEGNAEFRRIVGTQDASSAVAAVGAFDPTGRLLIACSHTQRGLRVYDAALGRELAAPQAGPIRSACFDPAGRFFITAGTRGIHRWPVARTGQHIRIGPPQSVAPNTDVERIDISADGRVLVFTHRDDTSTFTVIDLVKPGPPRRIACLPLAQLISVSGDGRWAALGTWGGTGTGGEVWDLGAGTRLVELPLLYNSFVQFAPDGRRLVTSDGNGLSLWDCRSWELLRRDSNSSTAQLRFTSDGTLLAVTDELNRIKLKNPATLEDVAAFESPEQIGPSHVAFSPDGGLMAVFTQQNHIIHLWDIRLIRARLKVMGLDWDSPAYPDADQPAAPQPVKVEIDIGDGSGVRTIQQP